VARLADGAVVASSLIETLAADLVDGRAVPGTVEKFLGQIQALANAVRTARHTNSEAA
jgi:hypothetical protein